jgi:hypothetical protein
MSTSEDKELAQIEKNHQLGVNSGWYDATHCVYKLAQELPKEQRNLVIDKIWRPLSDEADRLYDATHQS